jgi:hypothetical protein
MKKSFVFIVSLLLITLCTAYAAIQEHMYTVSLAETIDFSNPNLKEIFLQHIDSRLMRRNVFLSLSLFAAVATIFYYSYSRIKRTVRR